MATSRLCSIPDCGKPVWARGWCGMHYQRWKASGGLLTLPPRPTTCAIDGCSKPTERRGWCNIHYRRWKRHGDPLVPTRQAAPAGELRRYLNEVVIPYDGNDCLIWPYTRISSGYAKIKIARKLLTVSRIVCEHYHGPPPSPLHLAAHSCGNGQGGCVTPRHLRWATHQENQDDMLIHGTRIRGERNHLSKLTERDIPEIRCRLKAGCSQQSIANDYGVSQVAISAIHLKHSWAWLPEDA